MVNSDVSYGLADLVLSGFVRIVTHARAFKAPSPLDAALTFIGEFRERANAVRVGPGARHWKIFTRLCREAGARGNLVADAYLAVLAIESGSPHARCEEHAVVEPRRAHRPDGAASWAADASHAG